MPNCSEEAKVSFASFCLYGPFDTAHPQVPVCARSWCKNSARRFSISSSRSPPTSRHRWSGPIRRGTRTCLQAVSEHKTGAAPTRRRRPTHATPKPASRARLTRLLSLRLRLVLGSAGGCMFPHRLTDIAGKSVMDAAVKACKFHFLGGRGGIRVVADYPGQTRRTQCQGGHPCRPTRPTSS